MTCTIWKLPAACLILAGAAAFSTTAHAQSTSTITAQNSQKCLDISGYSTKPGLSVEQWSCNGGSNQSFSFVPVTGGHYQLQPQHDKLCLDIASNGVQVIQNTCSSSTTQQWSLLQAGVGTYTVVSSSGTCLDISGESTANGGNVIAYSCHGSSNEQFAIPGFSPASASSTQHNPTGISGSFTSLIDATFGTGRTDATVKSRADLDHLAYYWFEYGPSSTDPAYPFQAGAPNNCMGPTGNGTDSLTGNFYSRFLHCSPGSPWDRHVLSTDRLTLKANCGLQDNNPGNCSDGNIGGGMLRFIKSFRPTANNPIIVEMQGIMPKGDNSWPAFWINPGEQAPRNADGTPGKLLSFGWPPEIDIFDEFLNKASNNVLPGSYLVMGTPTNNNDAAYSSALCSPQGLSICDLPITPGGATLPTTSVAYFNNWYATTDADLTAGMHVYGAHIYPDHVDALLDGVVYRSRGYTWPTGAPPMQLILSNQTAAKFNNLTGLVDQGGVTNGWNWAISYIRVWQQN